MGKNQSASNLTNIIKQDANGSIAFMSGSTMLMALSNTGQMSGSAPAMSAVTASYADNFTVKGTLTAQTIVSQVVTSSTSLITGSTIFGTLVANTHQFTGSVSITGSNHTIYGNVGIGTTPSGYRLNVAGQAVVSNILVGSGYRVEFADAGSTSWSWIEGSSYDRAYSFLSFNTSGSEKMRLTSTGLLGIGTTTPANYLHIKGLNPNLIIQNTTSSVGSESNLTFRSTFGNGDVAYLGYIRAIQQSTSQNTGDIAIHAYSTGSANEVIRIKGASGYVGIGTDSPDRPLIINGASMGLYGSTPALVFKNTASSDKRWDISISSTDFTINETGVSQRLRITSAGNVGIGTTSPSQLLSLAGNTGQPASSGTTQNGMLRLNSVSGGSGYGETLDMGFHVGVSGPSSYGWIQSTNTSNLSLAYRLALNPNGGNVGIGTNSPSTTLTVNGTITETSSIRYKENIETIKYGLDKVLQMRGVTYTRKENGLKEVGVIAEEINEIFPDLVTKNEAGDIETVSYGRFTAVLIEAVKDLQAQINLLKAK